MRRWKREIVNDKSLTVLDKFIRDYNLIKKSDLFDSEYYLEQNEDVKKNGIEHSRQRSNFPKCKNR